MLYNCKPVYEEMPGWRTDISAAESFDDLPRAALDYIARVEELAGVPVSMVSVGPQRKATLTR